MKRSPVRVKMKSILSIGVAFIILLPLFASFSTAMPIGKTIDKTYKGDGLSSSGNGTVTISIHEGFNPSGFLSRLGYTVTFDNTLGTKTVNFYSNITFHYLFHNAYEECHAPLGPMWGYDHSIFQLPFPMYPFVVTFTVTTDTSTNLSLSRTGIMLFNCHVLFIKGNETVTGPS